MKRQNTTMTFFIVFIFMIVFQTLPASSQHNSFIVHDRYGVPMVFVPSGSIQIGVILDEAVQQCEELRGENDIASTEDCRRSLTDSVPEGLDYLVTPVEEVSLDDYFIDQYEVTIQAYQECVNDDGCSEDVIQYISDFSPYQSLEEPMRYINYLDAEIYCNWRGGYIPSEAEWEYAARSSERLAFPWGDEFNGGIVNFCDSNCQTAIQANEIWDDGFATLAPVTVHTQDVSWVGAVGMAGNVSEWTSTIYTYQLNSDDAGTSPNLRRIIKGGYFGSTADQILLWRRLPLLEQEIREGIGFRCAKRL